MSDDIYQTDEQETLEMDEVQEQVIMYCIEEAKEKLIATGSFEPFTVVVVGEDMTVETHPGDDPEAIQKFAKAAVSSASSFATHYCFCFDGFLDTDQGEIDAIIVHSAQRDMDNAYVIAGLYRIDESGDGSIEFEDGLTYVDSVETWLDRTAVAVGEATEIQEAQEQMERQQTQAKAQEMLERLKAQDGE